MMKEGRGRSSNGGAIELTKELGDLNLQVNAMVKDGTSLFDHSRYHKLQKDKNVVYLRPIISYRNNDISAALAMERNVVNNAYHDINGKWHDQSKRNGYGLTMSWNSAGDFDKSSEGLLLNSSISYLDAEQEKDFTAGINGIWKGIGYIYAANDIKAFNTNYRGDGEIYAKGKYKLHTVNASYLISNVMDMDNFNIYLGTYLSRLERDEKQGGGNDNRYGARVRFKYFF